jgi:integrase
VAERVQVAGQSQLLEQPLQVIEEPALGGLPQGFDRALPTGMRIGEAENLTWKDIDLDNRVVKIQEKEGWKPKTGDMRSVPMSSEVVELLGRQPRHCQWVFTFPADHYGPVRIQ